MSSPGLDPAAGLAEEAARQAAYGGTGGPSQPTTDPNDDGSTALLKALNGAALVGKYLPEATTYKFFEITTPYILKPAVLVFSVAGTDRQAATRIFRIGSDVMYRCVYWTAIRKGDWPTVPNVDEEKGPLVHANITPLAPVVAGLDAQDFVFQIKGEYIYVLDYPDDLTDTTLTAPIVPFLSVSKSRQEITLSNDPTNQGSDSEDLTSAEAGD